GSARAHCRQARRALSGARMAQSAAAPQPGIARPASAAILVALAAFTLYRATLLPGFDFGDTGSFQTIVSFPLITPRDGYPLYFAIGRLLVSLSHAQPAWLLNLASAGEGASACGLIVLVGAELSASTAAGAAAGLLFAVSYTFWSQA